MPLDLIWTGRMADEIDNVRGLVPTLAESDCSTAQRLACSIGQYLDLTQAYSQGIDEVDRYTRLLTEPTPERVGLLTRLADLRMRVGDLDTASAALHDAVALQRQVGPAPWDEVSVERSDGELALRSGEYERAAGLAEQMLGRDISRFGQGRMWNLLGIARISAGDAAGAAIAFEREIDSWKQVGREALLVSAHGNLAEALIRVGDRQRAAQHQLVCLELAVQYGQPLMVAYSAMVAARFAGDDGDWATATRLQTAADRELHRIGHMMYPADRAAAEAMLAEAEMHLGPAEFAAGRASMVEISALVAHTTDVLQGVGR
jgi:tetratricopeptide (TPR) repeat protein